jgi:DNA-binding IclR family transcriptional regulator
MDAARDEMRQLAAELDLEFLLVARVFDEMVAVARAGPQLGSSIDLRVGQRVPLVPPLGSVFLAWDSEAAIDEWLARAALDATAEELSSSRDMLSAVRGRGYSVGLEVEPRERSRSLVAKIAGKPRARELRDRLQDVFAELAHSSSQLDAIEEGRRYNVAMIMAPVFDSEGKATLALSMSGFREKLPAEDVRRFGEILREAGLRTTRATRGLAGS